LVFAGTTSNETLAMMPTLTRDKILSMQLAGSSIVDSPYQFALPNYIPTQAKAVVAAIQKKYPSAKKVGIIISSDAQGTALLQGYEASLTAAGLTYSAQTFAPSATDVTPQLQALQAASPDVVIASGYGAVAGYILKDRATLGWTVPVVGDGQLGANNLPALVPTSALTGVSLCVQSSSVYKPLGQQSKAFQTFYDATASKGGDFSEPIVLYSLSYDDLILVALAAKQANSIAAPAIAKALENLKQPKIKPYVTWSVEGFTSTIHVEQAPVADYTLASPFTKQGMALPLS
jgi:branched-chain amino acid transport system substrate-binding protein